MTAAAPIWLIVKLRGRAYAFVRGRKSLGSNDLRQHPEEARLELKSRIERVKRGETKQTEAPVRFSSFAAFLRREDQPGQLRAYHRQRLDHLLRVITKAMKKKYELPKAPCEGVETVSESRASPARRSRLSAFVSAKKKPARKFANRPDFSVILVGAIGIEPTTPTVSS